MKFHIAVFILPQHEIWRSLSLSKKCNSGSGCLALCCVPYFGSYLSVCNCTEDRGKNGWEPLHVSLMILSLFDVPTHNSSCAPARYHVHGRGRVPGATGIWVGDSKIAAIGVKISHGIRCESFRMFYAVSVMKHSAWRNPAV